MPFNKGMWTEHTEKRKKVTSQKSGLAVGEQKYSRTGTPLKRNKRFIHRQEKNVRGEKKRKKYDGESPLNGTSPAKKKEEGNGKKS